jgi:uncharacterized protein YbjT (DUF2867 family)
MPPARLITVFGASGFLGRYVVRDLARAGYRIRAAVRHTNMAHILKPMGVVGQIQIMQTNVRVPATIDRALEGAWGAINLVGILNQTGAQNFTALHAHAPGLIANAAKKAGVEALLHVSALGADADSDSDYFRTKAVGEQAVRAAFPEATIFRPSLVFGPEDEFFNKFASLARFSPVLPLFGGGTTRFQPIFAGDIGMAARVVMDDPAHWGKTFELGGPSAHTFRELMEEMLKAVERKRVLLPLPWSAAKLLATASMFVPSFIAKPPITFDQIRQLQVDNVVTGAPGIGTLADLGISPRAMEVELPTYLWRFRKSGQFEVSGLA